MNIFETVRTALESLASNKLRTILTMLGVIIGVASVVSLLSIGAGVSSGITSRVSSLGSNLLTISTDGRNSAARLTNNDVAALADPLSVPGADRVVPEVRGNSRAAAGIYQRNTQVAGTTPDMFTIRNITLSDGAVFTQQELDLRTRDAIMGATVADVLFPAGGAVGQTVLIDNVPFRVAGVADKKGGFGPSNPDDVIYVPLTVAQEKLFVRRATGLKSVSNIYIETSATAKAETVKADITAVLRAQHNLGDAQADDFRLVDQAEIANNLESIATFLTIFLGAVGAISLLVGGIGIMNIMLVSVTERTREIGVRKALGARRANILSQFLVEALTVSAVAGLIGVGFGLAISAAAGNVPGFVKPVVAPGTIIVSFGFSVLIGVVFGLYPAWRASRLVPVDALRYE